MIAESARASEVSRPLRVTGMTDTRTSTVGIIGTGTIGTIVARHVLAAGRPVLVWDRRAEVLATLAEAGARAAKSLAEMGTAPMVFSIVFDDEATEEVTLGPGGLLETLAPGGLHVAMATISPGLSRKLHESHTAKGQRYLAASMFGRPEAAEAAQIIFNCSGFAEAYEQAAPVLKLLGSARWIGPAPEQAMLVKLIGNNMIYAAVESLREMFDFLSAGGVGMREAKEAIVDRLFPGLIYQGYAERLIEDPVRPKEVHPIREKDSRVCLEVAQAMGIELPLIRFLREMSVGPSRHD
jgi:3-hydroxyisobutyrate dehydrogenase-like beta-hydroxyacid dehydrogenase